MLDHPVFKSILSDPSDDQARLVFADWMEEQGSQYAEFIRLQIEIANFLISDASLEKVMPLVNRAQTIFSRNHNRWNQSIYRLLKKHGVLYRRRRGEVRRWSYRRGFVESIEISGPCFVNHWDVISQIGPINFVLIENSSGDLFDGWQRPKQVSHLCIRNSSNAELTTMAQSGLFDGLVLLELRNTLVGFDAAQALAKLNDAIEGLVIRGCRYDFADGQTSLAPLRNSFGKRLVVEPKQDERNRLDRKYVDSTKVDFDGGLSRQMQWPMQRSTVQRVWNLLTGR